MILVCFVSWAEKLVAIDNGAFPKTVWCGSTTNNKWLGGCGRTAVFQE